MLQYYFEHTKWSAALEAAKASAGQPQVAWLMFSSATLYTVRLDQLGMRALFLVILCLA